MAMLFQDKQTNYRTYYDKKTLLVNSIIINVFGTVTNRFSAH